MPSSAAVQWAIRPRPGIVKGERGPDEKSALESLKGPHPPLRARVTWAVFQEPVV